MPSMLTSFAFSVRHVNVVDCPAVMLSGFAESDAVGAAGGGGGGGGGAEGFFLAQPPTSIRAARANTTRNFLVLSFTSSSNKVQQNRIANTIYRDTRRYFQLQLGCMFR